jgi:hypothetical protein
VIAELRAAGYTTEHINLAIAYVAHHEKDFDKPVHSIGFLPHIIEKAKAEGQQQVEAEEKQRRQIQRIQHLDEQAQVSVEDAKAGLTSVRPKFREPLQRFAEKGTKTRS